MVKQIRILTVIALCIVSMASLADETIEISAPTAINHKTLYTDCPSRHHSCSSYIAVLSLPDLSAYTNVRHYAAFYVAGESADISADQLVAQLIAEAAHSDGYLDVNFVINKQYRYEMHYGGRAYRESCVKYFFETISVQFHNGLVLEDLDRVWMHEVPSNPCCGLSNLKALFLGVNPTFVSPEGSN